MFAALEEVTRRKAPQKSRQEMRLGIPDMETQKAGRVGSMGAQAQELNGAPNVER